MEEGTKKEGVVKQPPPKKTRKSFSVFSCYLGEKIDLKRLQESLKKYPYITRDHPIVLKLATGQYAVLTKFGVVTFWNVPKNLREEFIQEISQFVEEFDKNR
jgi:uncharacterized Rmd1/YagE family protein